MRGMLAVVLVAWCAAGSAQTWPAKPVRFILPNSAGSGPDAIARIAAGQFEKMLGQPFIIENRPGANFLIAAEAIKTAPNDGYTIGLGSATMSGINQHMYKQLPYDANRDFEYIGILIDTIWGFFGVHPSMPVKTFQQFVELGRKHPEKYSLGVTVPSNGMWTRWVMKRLGVELVQVDYKTTPQLIQDSLSGRVETTTNSFAGYEYFLKDGRLRGLVAITNVRHPEYPNLPPISDFAPGTGYDSWIGIIAPKGVPEPMMQRLNRAIDTAVRDPEFSKRAMTLGWSNREGARTPKVMTDLVRIYRDKWGEILREAGVKPQ